MTNEDMALLIQQGGNDELLPLMWNKVKKYLFSKSKEAYNKYNPFFISRDIELEDIKQECYCVMIKAIKGYKQEQKFKFTSYLKYPFINMLHELLGTRTSKTDTLDKAYSLDKEIITDNDTYTLEDTVIDNTINVEDNVCTSVSDSQIASLLWQQVYTLQDRQKDILIDRYKNNKTLAQIGKEKSLTTERIRQIEGKSLQALRGNTEVRRLADIFGYDSYKAYHSGLSSFKVKGYSEVEEIALQRITHNISG